MKSGESARIHPGVYAAADVAFNDAWIHELHGFSRAPVSLDTPQPDASTSVVISGDANRFSEYTDSR